MPATTRAHAAGVTGPLRIVLAADAVAVGGGYLLGPARWSSSGTFAVVRDFGLPIPAWGALFVLVAVLVAAPAAPRIGFGLGVFVYFVWGASLAAALSVGELQGWGAPWHNLAFAALHGVGLWRSSAAGASGGR